MADGIRALTEVALHLLALLAVAVVVIVAVGGEELLARLPPWRRLKRAIARRPWWRRIFGGS